MPLYEWRCPTCGERFDAIRPVGTSETACTACGSPSVRAWTKAPGVVMRPAGYSTLKPGDPGYSSNLVDKERHRWQIG